MDTWIVEMTRNRAQRRVIAWTLAAGAVGLLLLAQSRYIRNFFGGPYEMAEADLDGVGDLDATPRVFVHVTGAQSIDTGVQQITVRKVNGVETGRSVSAAYYALVVGNRLLLYKSGSGSHEKVEGALERIPPRLEVNLFSDPEAQAARARFYPFYVDDESYRFPGVVEIGALAVFALLAWVFARRAWAQWRNPGLHPLVQRVARWGDPLGVAVAAQREARVPRHTGGGWLLTDRFAIRKTLFTFDVLRLGDLQWAYEKVTKHSVNFIPTGKTYQALLCCDGGTATVPGKQDAVHEMLVFAAKRAPWAVFGYSDEVKEFVTRRPREFAEAIETRRRSHEQKEKATA